LAQFEQVLAAGVDIILLDNMNCVQMKKAVTLRNKNGKWRRPLLEASGGITLKNIEQVARTGVDRISVGAVTHSRRSIDVSMEFIEE
jgi:nicotinate-nucleotide pyrophosphorylase (carboxylating)